MAEAYQKVMEGADSMKNAPSIKDAKPAKKTNVKNYPGLGIAPTIKEGAGKTNVPGVKIGGSIKKPDGKTMKVEEVIEDSYSVSIEDGFALEEGKKKCKDGYEWDSDEGKCVKKKKSSKTTIIIGRGYGGHSHDDDKDDDNEGGNETGGGDAGGGDGGGGGE